MLNISLYISYPSIQSIRHDDTYKLYQAAHSLLIVWNKVGETSTYARDINNTATMYLWDFMIMVN